ncbi:PX-associated-domain-containing protein [Madurella fahalii]|uniref:PX-associated-domain-containing protein n=1 Tax=Madurella fahalii TaxID=1157608 RepID=A0ABQ0GEI2_9PEZI
MEKQPINNTEPPGHGVTTSAGPEALTPCQLHALFDILTHHETYAEVERFKDPGTISEYGYPFAQRNPGSAGAPSYAADSSAPLLAGLLRSIVLPCPGVRDLPAEFWHVRFQGILEKLAEAELSESYDKGVLGTRKTLATAASAIHEIVSRGILGGIPKGPPRYLHGAYDRNDAKDLVRAWEDVVHELLYGALIDELFACATERPTLEEHSPAVLAAVDYIIIHLATLLHHVFVLSAEGPYLLKLLENVHKLLPYSMVKQTLRIGNVATMLNGMMRLLLAKVGVGALSNWVGLTQNADDGMNLLQRIISLVLSWDSSEFRKSAESIEKAKGGSSPTKEQLAAIRAYLDKPRDVHGDARIASIDGSKSMIATIMERSNPALLASLSDTQHARCLEYFSALLAARDRDEIANALCRQNPDLFTQALKDAVASFEPMIRAVHEGVDLREHVSAAEGFLTDLINVCKAKKGDPEARVPSVEDFVMLLRRNRQLLYNWLHQVASQCPVLRDDFCAWAKETIKVFRQDTRTSPGLQTTSRSNPSEQNNTAANTDRRNGAAGAMSSSLQHLFASQSPETKSRVLPAIDAHAAYLSDLSDLSLERMQRILDNMTTTTSDPDTAPATLAPPSNPSSSTSTSYFSPGSWSGRSSPAPPNAIPKPKTGTNSSSPAPGSFAGPGMFLARWQHLLDETLIAPAAFVGGGGPLRKGKDVKGLLARGKTVAQVGGTAWGKDKDGNGGGSGGWDSAVLARMAEEEAPRAPDVGVVVEVLGEGFRELVAGLVRS